MDILSAFIAIFSIEQDKAINKTIGIIKLVLYFAITIKIYSYCFSDNYSNINWLDNIWLLFITGDIIIPLLLFIIVMIILEFVVDLLVLFINYIAVERHDYIKKTKNLLDSNLDIKIDTLYKTIYRKCKLLKYVFSNKVDEFFTLSDEIFAVDLDNLDRINKFLIQLVVFILFISSISLNIKIAICVFFFIVFLVILGFRSLIYIITNVLPLIKERYENESN